MCNEYSSVFELRYNHSNRTLDLKQWGYGNTYAHETKIYGVAVDFIAACKIMRTSERNFFRE